MARLNWITRQTETTLGALEVRWVATLAGFPSLSHLLFLGEVFRLHSINKLDVAMNGLRPAVLPVL